MVQTPSDSIRATGSAGGGASGISDLFSDASLAMLAKLSQPSKVIPKSSSIIPVQASSIADISSLDMNSIQSLQHQQMSMQRLWDANLPGLNTSGAYTSPLSISAASRQGSVDDPMSMQPQHYLQNIEELGQLQAQMQTRIAIQSQALQALGHELTRESVAGLQQMQAQMGSNISNNDGGVNAIPRGMSEPVTGGGSVSRSSATDQGSGFVESNDSMAKFSKSELEVERQLLMLQAQIQQSQLRLLHAVKLNHYQHMVRSRQRNEHRSMSIEEDAEGSDVAVGSKRRAEGRSADGARARKVRKTANRKSDPLV